MTALLATLALLVQQGDELKLANPIPEKEEARSHEAAFSIGPRAGFLRARDADDGTWFAGGQVRLHFGSLLAIEGSITYHQEEFQNGNVVVTQYPVEVSALIFPFPAPWQFQPYFVGGAGWYYTHYVYRGILAPFDDETEHVFGAHLGGGVDLRLSPFVSLNGDVRYIFIDPDADRVARERFDYWQITVGLNLRF